MCCALVALSLLGACDSPAATNDIKVISYNIRYSGAPDVDGDNYWTFRKEASLKMIDQEQPTVMGMQEVCPDQLAYLVQNLTNYKHIGVGREDGVAEGECMAIFYDTRKVTLGANGTFWLSETPDSVSQGWDGACKRTCTWGVFKMIGTGKEFVYFNTHLDHRGKIAREESIKLLVSKIAELAPQGLPVFLTADFNSSTSEPIFDPLKAVLKDARATSPVTDNGGTYTGFGESEGVHVIDHIFYKGATPKAFRVLRGDYGAPYISDHYPIVFTGELE